MTIKTLIEELSKFDNDTEVMTYNDESQDYGSIDEVLHVELSSDDAPYAQGDKPERDKKVIVLNGGLA